MFRSPRADAEAFAAILEDERRALVDGAHDRLGGLAAIKEKMIARLSGRVAEHDARRLSELLARNAALLVAAAKGIQAAKQQIEALHACPTLSVYHADGQRETVRPASGRMERRA